MTGVEAIFGVLGAVASAAGAIAQGKAQAAAAEYNEKVDKQMAVQRQEAANAEASDYKRTEHRHLASSQAALGAMGITEAGSPLMVDEATVREIALGAARKSYEGSVEATRLRNSAQLEKMQGKAAEQASYLSAGTSLLSGFGSMFG